MKQYTFEPNETTPGFFYVKIYQDNQLILDGQAGEAVQGYTRFGGSFYQEVEGGTPQNYGWTCWCKDRSLLNNVELTQALYAHVLNSSKL